MKLRTTASQLLTLVSKVSDAVPQKPTEAIFENIIITTIADDVIAVHGGDGNLVATATGIVESVDGDPVAVNCRKLMDILKVLPDSEIDLTADGVTAMLKWSRGTHSLPVVDAKDYPPIPTLDEGIVLQMEGMEFRDAIDHTLPCVASDELRPIMGTILVDPDDDGKVNFVASDAKVMTISHKDVVVTPESKFCLPSVAARIVRKAFRADDDVIFKQADKWLCVTDGNLMIYVRKVEGNFPNYKSVIPKGGSNVLSSPTSELISSVRRAMACADKDSNTVKLILSPMDVPSIEAHDLNFGLASSESMDYATYDGTEMDICLNAAKLHGVVSLYKSNSITISLDTPNRAVLISSESDSTLALVMPVCGR